MSSCIFLKFDEPVRLADWKAFCASHRVIYSPCTVGRNIFYGGNEGEVEISFGEPVYDPLPQIVTRPEVWPEYTDTVVDLYRKPTPAVTHPDFSVASPRPEAKQITLSVNRGTGDGAANLARDMVDAWPSRSVRCSPEFRWQLMNRGLKVDAASDE
jgi:hypothetical protein